MNQIKGAVICEAPEAPTGENIIIIPDFLKVCDWFTAKNPLVDSNEVEYRHCCYNCKWSVFYEVSNEPD